ncbi:TLD-domain-containing protein [Basidiobolus meristosporus CBS 931.73]|uniref:Oxidation resistance protein 1 n=1 Tax=Basidiobolus meristosporus CBS 931.73 TaxID=1314790 RepID=A0A1Y1YZI6_9FUNG|nr:TLD-domain-containing protein [Basidiobolus meristosporus CBS 931.73]|eukprot:ORY03107.1 TLD-domain-containing protein [Basidiobolus meristosporus CBS 931.73]
MPTTSTLHRLSGHPHPSISKRHHRSPMLTSKASGGHHWIFPQVQDKGTIAVDYVAVQCNAVSPPGSPKLSDKAGRHTVRKWRAHSVPTMVPRQVHRVNFNHPARLISSYSTSIHAHHTEEDEEYHSDPEDQLNSFIALSHNYRHVHRRTLSLPIEPSKVNLLKPLQKALELPPIQLIGRSFDEEPLLTVGMAEQISRHIPHRLRLNRSWRLLFSLEQHGCTLSTLFKITQNKGPSVLVIRDACGSVFGAFVTEHFKPSPSYYGGGECFLWKLRPDPGHPRVKVYKRTGENEYYMLSENRFIAVGGGNGTFGLWLDGNLDRGFSARCSTFDNEVLATSSAFSCMELEIWSC